MRKVKQIFGILFLVFSAYAGIEGITEGRHINDWQRKMGGRRPQNRTSEVNGVAYSNRPIYYGLTAVAGALLLMGIENKPKEPKINKEPELKNT